MLRNRRPILFLGPFKCIAQQHGTHQKLLFIERLCWFYQLIIRCGMLSTNLTKELVSDYKLLEIWENIVKLVRFWWRIEIEQKG